MIAIHTQAKRDSFASICSSQEKYLHKTRSRHYFFQDRILMFALRLLPRPSTCLEECSIGRWRKIEVALREGAEIHLEEIVTSVSSFHALLSHHSQPFLLEADSGTRSLLMGPTMRKCKHMPCVLNHYFLATEKGR